jgi:hypothetical protein
VSLLSACKAVVGETGLGSVPATIISNTDPGVVQLYYIALRSAEEIAKKNWQRMCREHSFQTVNGTEGYSLPSDWARYIGDTAWDSDNYWQMAGSLSPQMWNTLKRSIVTAPQSRKAFRVRGNQVLMYPTPTAADDLVIEYVRSTPWIDSTGVTWRALPTADTDITGFPETLLVLDMKWRLAKAKGMPYEEDYNEAQNAIDVAYAQDTPAPTLNLGLDTNRTPNFLVNVPQSIS